jgi:hypothetical protein
LENTKHSFKCGPFEVLRIAHAGHQHMKEINAQGDIVLKACRRNHFLAYRPSLSQGKLVEADKQKWAMEMPAGQHRIQKSWAADRYTWLSDAGVPKAPDWSFKTGANVKCIEDMEDATCFAEEGSKILLSSWLEDPDLCEGVEDPGVSLDVDEDALEGMVAINAQMAVKLRRREQAVHELTTSQAPDQKQKAKKAEDRAKIRLALKEVLPEWKEQLKGELKEFSRAQLLRALVPVAGKSSKQKKDEVRKASQAFKCEPNC